jgi:two-component system, response regulator RegA
MTSSGKTMLLVDDDERFRERLGRALAERGYQVREADGHDAAMRHAAAETLDRAVVDLRMPGPNGLEVVKGLLEKQPALEVVVLTGYGSIATAVEAVRLGALDYLTKPCHADRVLGAFEAKAPGETREATFETPSLARLEREHIERVLTECGGNVSKAARVLGVHRRTLQYKLAMYPVQR